MKKFKSVGSALAACCCFVGVARANINADLQEASEKLQPILDSAEPIVADGRVAEVNARLLAFFPERTRTPVQALVLGNVLFRQDPVTSYSLHKRAAEALPDEPAAQLEWALEQHRAGEFAAAADTYAKVIKAQPKFGPVYGLQADCLIRTGQTKEAVEAWLRSEKGGGSIQTLESWVCEVHTHKFPDRERAPLYAKAKAGDAAAAVELVAGDCGFQTDWWNIGPKADYLEKDLAVLRGTKFPTADAVKLSAAGCAAACGIYLTTETGDPADVLKEAGFLLDGKSTLPANGRFLSTMLAAAESAHAITNEQARDKFGPAVFASANQSKDAEMYNVAAHLYLGTDRLAEIDQAGWDATGEARFAASRIVGLAADNKLTLDEPRLMKAVKEFPGDANIARVFVALTARAQLPTDAAIVAAIKAEFDHFSIGGGLLEGRPSASMVKGYFSELSKSLNVKVADAGDPRFEVGEQRLVGNELRCLVRTWREAKLPFSRHSQVLNEKEWLALIDLTKPGPIEQRSRVIGPLWDVNEPKSSISFSAGANVEQQNPDLAAAPPFATFDAQGAVQRLSVGTDRSLRRDALQVGPAGASWVAQPYQAIDEFEPDYKETGVDSDDHSVHVQKIGDAVTVYDLFSGKKIDDPWLASVFGQRNAIEHFLVVETWLTPDRKYLVCNPGSTVNMGIGGPVYDKFTMAGKEYSRGEFGVIWSKPDLKPTVFKKGDGIGVGMDKGPSGAYSIGGKLYLLYETADEIRLDPIAEGKRFLAKAPVDQEWRWRPASARYLDEANHCLTFNGDDFMRRHDPERRTTVIFKWDYQTAKVDRLEAKVFDLFRVAAGEFAAKTATAVSGRVP